VGVNKQSGQEHLPRAASEVMQVRTEISCTFLDTGESTWVHRHYFI